MSPPVLESEILIEYDQEYYKDKIAHFIKPNVVALQRVLKSYTLFNLLFVLLICVEIGYFFVHLTFLAQSFIMAIHLALIFATVFCYFTLHMYAQTRKIEKFASIKLQFIQTCLQVVPEPEEIQTSSLIAKACCKLAESLHAYEYQIYKCPAWCAFLSSSFEKLNCWWFWQDVHLMKEMLLQTSIEKHIKCVRIEPTNLEAHASLANAYVMMSGLFVDPRTVEGLDDERWIPPNKYNKHFKQKFRAIAERAIEEFQILSDYAPDDPWVHAQLAYSYRDLQMPEEEIKEYEIILQLCPEDKETLLKLGKLYFEQGQNAKGLVVYEALRKSNYKKAESLIHYYGAYSNSQPCADNTISAHTK